MPDFCGKFEFLTLLGEFRRGLCWRHCKYKEWVSFFLGSWDMNRSAEQTNRTRTASRFTRFVCSALRFISHEPRKKDTHSLIVDCIVTTRQSVPDTRTHPHSPNHTRTTDPLYRLRHWYSVKVAYTSGPIFEKNMKRYPIFSVQNIDHQIDQRHE